MEGTLTVGEAAAGARPAASYATERGLYGRERELDALGQLLGKLGEDAGGALVVRGEAGIGKSALLAAVGGQAMQHETQVLSAVGVQSEAQRREVRGRRGGTGLVWCRGKAAGVRGEGKRQYSSKSPLLITARR